MTALKSPARVLPGTYTIDHEEVEGPSDAASAAARARALLHRDLARAPVPVAVQRLVTALVPSMLAGATVQIRTASGVPLLHVEQVAPTPVALEQWLARAGRIACEHGGTVDLDTVFADAPVRTVASFGVSAQGIVLMMALAESRSRSQPLLTEAVVAELMETLLPRLHEVTSLHAHSPIA